MVKRKKPSRSPFRRQPSKMNSLDTGEMQQEPRKSTDVPPGDGKRSLRWRRLQGKSTAVDDLNRLSKLGVPAQAGSAPPSYGEHDASALALPVPRFSESSRSDGSSGDRPIYGSTTTTTHTVSTHTTFFKLPRRNKNRNSLFPLPVRLPPPSEQLQIEDGPATPRASISALSVKSMSAAQSPGRSPPGTALQRRHTEASNKDRSTPPPLPPLSHAALNKSSLTFAGPGANVGRSDSQRSSHSTNSSPLAPPMRLSLRDRASTTSSFGRQSEDVGTPPALGSARNSTSTSGRASLGGLLSLSRFRQGSEPHSPRHGSPGSNSKSNSFAMSREALVIPEREEGDTPGKYLERLEAAVSRSMIAGILSKSADPFAQAVLRSYTRRFPFFGEPIDMSLRKFLLEAELPKETQQVDRVVQAFADRYHECNPGIFLSPDQAYIIAFSLMMLHTDAFNKNNKRKMQKNDYVKNTSGQHVSDEILACFYDNICYTPFVHYEEEVDINGERLLPFKPKKSKLKGAMTDATGKKPSGPIDPYTLLIDSKLDMLRPSIKDSISMDDSYNYLSLSTDSLDIDHLNRAFTHTGVLQIVSARSRPNAYSSQEQRDNPTGPGDSQAGVVDLKITKVGTLWRKAAKRKKTRSPWQEWGAILTGSQLYLFKNAPWVKSLVHQYQVHQKHGAPRTPVLFKPPVLDFKPDALIKTDNAVALVDCTYNRHKHAFSFVRPGGQEEVLLADNEHELNEWLGLINYAAAFRAAGVRIRGMVGGNEEDIRSNDVRRLDSNHSTRSLQAPNGEVVRVQRGGLSPQLQRQVMAARRQIMLQKIHESEKEILEANKQLDAMLRNARHLQVLAPIQQKTREDVIHAAAHVDANIKWTRRDIWRTKCHKDILALDVQVDGVSASEIAQMDGQVEAPGKIVPAKELSRLTSKASNARSPPQSPMSPSHSARPGTTSSVETFMGNDVFRTPPESATNQSPADPWRLPPLELDIPRDQRQQRGSVTSTMLSASPRPSSLSHASSTSSMRHAERLGSPVASDTTSRLGRITPTSSVEDRELEILAKNGLTPEAVVSSGAKPVLEGSATPTPESSSKGKGVRRSLHKTLRDAHHHHPSSVHRHRRGKESDGTLRSENGEEMPEGTPGLERATGRFILHGKQASVIQFGSEWPNERMKVRRELWRQNSGSPPTSAERAAFRDDVRAHMADSTVHEGDPYEGASQSSTSTSMSTSTARNSNFNRDAEAAASYARASPSRRSAEEDWPSSYFDLSAPFDPDLDKKRANRQTVIGPSVPVLEQQDTLEKGEDGLVVVNDSDVTPRQNRRTVVGPSIQVNGPPTPDEEMDEFIGKDELRRLSEADEIETQRLRHSPSAQAVKA